MLADCVFFFLILKKWAGHVYFYLLKWSAGKLFV